VKQLQSTCPASSQTIEGDAIDRALSRLARAEEHLESARDKLAHWRCKLEATQLDCKWNATKTQRKFYRDMARH
jgi:hypothetical protein